jgi:tRNA-dihydrouridine synthase|tara:strand:+ start:4547 stop:4996 length:450 start_codon:yes stop_codon:yes gene_type:complete
MDNKKWSEFYQKNRKGATKVIWIKIMTSDGKHFFFHDYDEWYNVKEYCNKNSVIVEDLHLQFRSNKCIIDVTDADGIYFVRSVLGAIGMKTKEYYTAGVLRDGQVHKEMWLIPELIREKEYLDDIENCFDEAMIYYETKKKNRKEQVQT